VAGNLEVLCSSPERRTSMSCYFVKGKGWRYDFTLEGTRHTKGWFETKREARQAEANRREEILNPSEAMPAQIEETLTDMAFLDLINLRLDYVKAYNSENHYKQYFYLARGWVKRWPDLSCSDISKEMVQDHLLNRRKVSAYTANQDLKYLRAAMNWGLENRYIRTDPTKGVKFFPVEKKIKYVPGNGDIDKVIAKADLETRDYLWTLRETMARVSEINRLLWKDVNLAHRHIILYTRKKRGGHLTPRKVPMTKKLFEVLKARFERCDPEKPWVFWHRYWSRKKECFCIGPYRDRKKFMKKLCEKAGVRYFRFHPIRHAGASIMDGNNVPIGAIQRILGHENRKTTELYLHSIGDMERQAIWAYEQAREKSHTDSHTEPIKKKGGRS
jgi:integrase